MENDNMNNDNAAVPDPDKMKPGESDYDKSASCCAKGDELLKQGDTEQALTQYKQALELAGAVHKENCIEAVALCNNIGGILLKVKKDYAHAVQYQREAIKLYTMVYGDTDASAATLYNNIGDALLFNGDKDEALSWFEKSLELRKSLYTKPHPHVAVSYNNVGLVLCDKGEYEESLAYYTQAVRMCGAAHIEDSDLGRNILGAAMHAAECIRQREPTINFNVMQQILPLYYHAIKFECEHDNPQKAFGYLETMQTERFKNAVYGLPSSELFQDLQPLEPEAVRQWCGSSTAILAYAIPPADCRELDTAAYCFVVTGGGLQAIALDPEYDYAVEASKHQTFSRGPDESFSSYIPDLYAKLVKPVLSYIPEGTKKLLVIPDRTIAKLSFENLGDDEDGLLGYGYTLSRVPSVSAAIRKEQAAQDDPDD